ncbi:Glutamate receptor 1, variant 2 [Chamberlinius hualienensis]
MRLNASMDVGLLKIVSNGLLKGLLDMFKYWEINKMRVFILETELGFNENDVYAFYKQNHFVIHQIIPVTKNNLMSKNWSNLLINYRFIVLLTSNSVAESIMTSANQPEMFKSFRNWIILSYNMNIPDMFKSPNMINFTNPLQSQITVLMPQRKKRSPGTGEEDERSRYFLEAANEAELLHKTTEEILLHDVFYNHGYKTVQHINYAKWTYLNGLHYYEDDNLPISGRYVRVSVMETVPYVIFNRSDFQKVGGILFNYHQSIEKRFGVIHKYHLVSDESYGTSDNGSFNGAIGHLYRGEGDVGIAAHGYSAQRKKAIHFLYMAVFGFMQMTIPRPSSQFPPTIYILPFNLSVWLVILGALMIIVTIIIINLSTNPNNEEFQNEMKSSEKFLFWLFSGHWLIDISDAPPGLSGKIISYTLITATTMTFVYYSSVFTSFLTYQELKLPFTNIEEMVLNDDYQVLIVKGGKHQEYFQVWQSLLYDKYVMHVFILQHLRNVLKYLSRIH